MDNGQEKEKWKLQLSKRLTGFLVIVIFIFVILVSRLFYLQIVNAQKFSKQSAENRIRINTIEARRGDILDVKGQVMATSQPVYVITIQPVAGTDFNKVISDLSELLEDPDLTPEDIKELVSNNPLRYEPTVVKKFPANNPEAHVVVAALEERRLDLPGVNIHEEPQRLYPGGPLAGHILGYVGQISQKELEARKGENYGLNDIIGKSGIESFLEYSSTNDMEIGLRGKKGAQQVEVDAHNRKVRDLLTLPPTPGDSVYLTIDMDLQRTMETALDQVIENVRESNPKAGGAAVVVMDVKTGAILAMASKPDINPNDFVDGSYSKKKDYYNNPDVKPLFNRSIQGVYPPGSTFKPVTALAALHSGAVRPTDTIHDGGRYWKPGGVNCWVPQGHGTVNLYRGMAVSCNTYFQWAGDVTGIKTINQIAGEFGLGQPTGLLGLQGEVGGILPSPEWKKKVNAAIWNRWLKNREEQIEKKYADLMTGAGPEEKNNLLRQKERELNQVKAQYQINYNFDTNWQPFDTFLTSMGQGANGYTMMQMANMVSTLANGGTRFRPYLVDKVVGPDGTVKREYQPEVINEVGVAPEVMEEVRKAMLEVTQSPEGTAGFLFRDFPDDIKVAAKTGTAQTGLAGDDKSKDFYGVFIAFAPYDDPQIAFAGLVEYAQRGGDSAGIVARKVFAHYFGLTELLNKPFMGVAVE